MNIAEYIAERIAGLGGDEVEKAVSVDEDTRKKTKLFLTKIFDLEFLVSLEGREINISVKTGMENSKRCLDLLQGYIAQWRRQDTRQYLLNPNLDKNIFTAQINNEDEAIVYWSVQDYFIEPVIRYLYPEKSKELFDSK